MPKPKVFVTRLIPAVGLDRVREYCDADVWTEPLPPSADVLRSKVADCEGLLSLLTERIDARVARRCTRVYGWSATTRSASTTSTCRPRPSRGIAVGNTPGVLTDATADMAFALLISAGPPHRRVGSSTRSTAQWKTWEPLGHIGQDLAGRTLGIVGMGRIGFAMARRCHGGWGMRVLYHDQRTHEQAERELGAERVESRHAAGRVGLRLRACRS